MSSSQDQSLINKVFSSDNTAGASPAVLQAMMDAGAGIQAPYGMDRHSEQVEQALADIFECPVSVFFVATGTAANALALSVYTRLGAQCFATKRVILMWTNVAPQNFLPMVPS